MVTAFCAAGWRDMENPHREPASFARAVAECGNPA
jgi:hypothetical protein